MTLKRNKGKVLMLGGSRLQVPAIEAAQQLGFWVLCADYDPNAVGFTVADAHSVTSTLDVDALEVLTRKHQVDFVITSTSDAPVRVAALISEKLGLPTGISSDNAVCATQKDVMRRRLAEYDVPMPEFRCCNNSREFSDALKFFDYECIAKPADAAASRGVALVTSADRNEDTEALFEKFVKFSRKGVVMVEEKVTGPEVSVEAMTVGGETTVLAITDKTTTKPPYFVELSHWEPSMLPGSVQNEIIEITKRVVQAIGIVDGPSHTEIIATDDGPKVIETAARLGGGYLTSRLVPLSTGVDMVKGSVAIALGMNYSFEVSQNKGSAIGFIMPTGSGTIKSIRVPEELSSSPGFEEVSFYRHEGDYIEISHSNNDYIGHVIFTGSTAVEAIGRVESALKMIDIVIA